MIATKVLWKRWVVVALLCCLSLSLIRYHFKPTEEDFYRLAEEETFDLRGKQSPLNHESPIFGIKDFVSKLPKLQHKFETESLGDRRVREARRSAVKNSFIFAWTGYKNHAMGADELKPVSGTSQNPFGGLGVTILDSLSTMLVMEMDGEVDKLIDWLETLNVAVDANISVFETIIRCIGGLLSAYELSTHPRRQVFLTKAEEFGKAILPAFDAPYGLPYKIINPAEGKGFENDTTYLADVATLQLEFFTLSHHTGDPVYAQKAQAINDFLDGLNRSHGMKYPGLYPKDIHISNGKFDTTEVSFGRGGDSAYEYLLKQYILSDGQESQYKFMYEKSIGNMKRFMLRQIKGSTLLFLPTYDFDKTRSDETMHQLTCFAPGMLAMGAVILNRTEDMMVARGLMETCVYVCRDSTTHLSPEMWQFPRYATKFDPMTYGKSGEALNLAREWRKDPSLPEPLPIAHKPNTKNRVMPEVTPVEVVSTQNEYFLRPETVESLFIMYRITGDPIYQEYGWMIYEAIEKYCKTDIAYAAIRDVQVDNTEVEHIDRMETFLLAETFKYLYLLFSPPDVISLDKFVFNTEAHPLLRRLWTPVDLLLYT